MLTEWPSPSKNYPENSLWHITLSTQLLWVSTGTSTLTKTGSGIKSGPLLFLGDGNKSTCCTMLYSIWELKGPRRLAFVLIWEWPFVSCLFQVLWGLMFSPADKLLNKAQTDLASYRSLLEFEEQDLRSYSRVWWNHLLVLSDAPCRETSLTRSRPGKDSILFTTSP